MKDLNGRLRPFEGDDDGTVEAPNEPGDCGRTVAARLLWLRARLGEALHRLEWIDNGLARRPDDGGAGEPNEPAQDLAGVLSDVESLTVAIAEATDRIDGALGDVTE